MRKFRCKHDFSAFSPEFNNPKGYLNLKANDVLYQHFTGNYYNPNTGAIYLAKDIEDNCEHFVEMGTQYEYRGVEASYFSNHGIKPGTFIDVHGVWKNHR